MLQSDTILDNIRTDTEIGTRTTVSGLQERPVEHKEERRREREGGREERTEGQREESDVGQNEGGREGGRDVGPPLTPAQYDHKKALLCLLHAYNSYR